MGVRLHVIVMFDATHGTRNGVIQRGCLVFLLYVGDTPQHPTRQQVDARHVRLDVLLVHFHTRFAAGDVKFGMERKLE